MHERINLIPEEATNQYPFDVGSVDDIEGRIFVVAAGEPLQKTIIHRLERIPTGIVVILAKGDTRVWFTDINEGTFDVNRSADVEIRLLSW